MRLPGDHVSPAGRVGTGRALVRLLPGVSPLVGGQVVAPAEHLVAHPARVGLEAGVQAHEAGQHVAPGKTAVAYFTEVGLGGGLLFVGLVPGGNVLGKAVVERELLSTDWALVGGGGGD